MFLLFICVISPFYKSKISITLKVFVYILNDVFIDFTQRTQIFDIFLPCNFQKSFYLTVDKSFPCTRSKCWWLPFAPADTLSFTLLHIAFSPGGKDCPKGLSSLFASGWVWPMEPQNVREKEQCEVDAGISQHPPCQLVWGSRVPLLKATAPGGQPTPQKSPSSSQQPIVPLPLAVTHMDANPEVFQFPHCFC